MHNPLYWIAANRIAHEFPTPDQALNQPDGLLAVGGDLSTPRLLEAYRKGIFPWYEKNQPILWWSPNPRTVLLPDKLRISRSLRRTLKRNLFDITIDRDFARVICACAEPRRNQNGTWLTHEMIGAYTRLHAAHYAHSVECWYKDRLVGGLYGVTIGKVFFGESMFSRMDDASKVGLAKLVQRLLKWDYRLMDCQVHSTHLERLGAVRIPRAEFIRMLDQWCTVPACKDAWQVTPEQTHE